MTEHDPVNNPSHYTSGKIEVIDFIEDQKLGFHLGNVVKYVARAGKKDASKELQDLKKARWYLDRKIEKLDTHVDASVGSPNEAPTESTRRTVSASPDVDRLARLAREQFSRTDAG